MNPKRQVLLVDDQEEILPLVQQAIGPLVDVLWADSIAQAKDVLAENEVDLILLDLGLPDGNGANFCAYLHAQDPLLPIIILTGKEDLSEKIMGFTAGADDYITKPFELLELKARVLGRLKKLELMENHGKVMNWKELSFLKDSQEVVVKEGSEAKKVELTTLEFKILSFFANHVGEVVSRDKLLDEVWGKNVHVYPRSVDTHVSKLRKKIGGAASAIESIHGTGYKFKPTAL